MALFTYNNAKNISTGHTPFELNCRYHPRVFFENKTNPCSRSRFTNKLVKKLTKLIEIGYQNLLYV